MRFITEIARHEVKQTRLLADVTVDSHAVAAFHAGCVEEPARSSELLNLLFNSSTKLEKDIALRAQADRMFALHELRNAITRH